MHFITTSIIFLTWSMPVEGLQTFMTNLWQPLPLLTKFLSFPIKSFEKFLCDLQLMILSWNFFKIISHSSHSHHMKIRQPCFYYTSTSKVSRYIYKNQIFTCRICWKCLYGWNAKIFFTSFIWSNFILFQTNTPFYFNIETRRLISRKSLRLNFWAIKGPWFYLRLSFS